MHKSTQDSVQAQGPNLLGFWFYGTSKNGDRNPNFGAGFLTENPGIFR